MKVTILNSAAPLICGALVLACISIGCRNGSEVTSVDTKNSTSFEKPEQTIQFTDVDPQTSQIFSDELKNYLLKNPSENLAIVINKDTMTIIGDSLSHFKFSLDMVSSMNPSRQKKAHSTYCLRWKCIWGASYSKQGSYENLAAATVQLYVFVRMTCFLGPSSASAKSGSCR